MRAVAFFAVSGELTRRADAPCCALGVRGEMMTACR